MIRKILLCLALSACSFNSEKSKEKVPTPVKLDPRVIYGSDNRLDLYAVHNPAHLLLADSTVALIRKGKLTPAPNQKMKVKGTNYGTYYNLCSQERFREQETAAFCSGFLVGSDLVVTAGHCVETEADCQTTQLAFGFGLKVAGQLPTELPESEVYSCARVIKTEQRASGADFAVIQLDRPVVGHQPLALRTSGVPQRGDALVVIGHPSGLPTKVSDGAQIREVKSEFLVTNLDTYGGNSGSAVFSDTTFEVEGILVRGENDYDYIGNCRVSKVCTDGGCRGEDVTLISEVLPYLPAVQIPVQEEYSSLESMEIKDYPAPAILSRVNSQSAPNGRKVFVEVEVEHTFIGDLRLILYAPDGREILLHSRTGGSQDNLSGVYGKSLSSKESLAQLANVAKAGDWVLKVEDLARLDSGKLVRWKLIFE